MSSAYATKEVHELRLFIRPLHQFNITLSKPLAPYERPALIALPSQATAHISHGRPLSVAVLA